VAAPFLGALALELLRSFAYEYAPNTWQMVVGTAMLAVILFLPSGLWSVFARRRAD
jgi:branched-chain amino acid transport system permease protein